MKLKSIFSSSSEYHLLHSSASDYNDEHIIVHLIDDDEKVTIYDLLERKKEKKALSLSLSFFDDVNSYKMIKIIIFTQKRDKKM